MDDRRLNARWALGRKAKIKLEGQDAFSECLIKEISLKGLSIVAESKMCEDEYAKVHIALTDDLMLDVEVWVVWRREMEGSCVCGMYFSKIRDNDREKIYRYVQQNYPQEIQNRWWRGASLPREEYMVKESVVEDRRVFNRFPVMVAVDYLEVDTGREGKAVATDISAKGVGLVLQDETLPVSKEVEMWLHIPDKGEPLYSRGSVSWTSLLSGNKQRAGINLEKADLMGLSRVLRAK